MGKMTDMSLAARKAFPEYFWRSDAPPRRPKAKKGKRYGVPGNYYEVRAHGGGWTTWHVYGETATPDAREVFMRKMRFAAERALERFAKRYGLREMP